MSGPSDRRRYRIEDSLQDIIENISKVERYVQGMAPQDVMQDELRRDAIERCIERICEAAFRLGDAARVLLPDHPWPDIRGMGNRLRHAYEQIDFGIVWNVVSDRLPKLKSDAEMALQNLKKPP